MQKKKEKIALFDFCGTMVPFQSAEAYVNYVIVHTSSYSTKCRHFLYLILRKLHIISRLERLSRGVITNKKIMIYQLKGLSKESLDSYAKLFFKEKIEPNFIPEILVKLREYQEQGYRLVIVSGGLDIYLQYVMSFFGETVDNLYSTTLLYRDGKCTGKMGFDCMGDNKILALQKKYHRDEIETVAYSDSETDYPLLSWANRGYFVIPIARWIDGKTISITEYKY